jgi:deoxyadenosine/deoxycytidine kinase
MSVQSIPAQQPSQIQWIIVEGNVGAGKSTFLKVVQQYLDVGLVFEPHEQWQQVADAGNLLDNFYQDPQRWAYTFQSYAFITRIMAQQKYAINASSSMCVLERSVFSDRYCFAKNAYESGNMTGLEWHLYKEWFSWLVHHYMPKPTGFIYLRVDPEVCLDRMHVRNRHEEASVPLDYLKQLHAKHESWLVQKNGVDALVRDVPVLVLDCNQDFEHNEELAREHVAKIVNFFPGITYKKLQNQTSYQASL